jgi:hypothetical protein
MQYPVTAPPAKLAPGAKIGIGVGSSSAAIFLVFLVWIVMRKVRAGREARRHRERTEQESVEERFSRGVDRSRVAHFAAGEGGKRYAVARGVSY